MYWNPFSELENPNKGTDILRPFSLEKKYPMNPFNLRRYKHLSIVSWTLLVIIYSTTLYHFSSRPHSPNSFQCTSTLKSKSPVVSVEHPTPRTRPRTQLKKTQMTRRSYTFRVSKLGSRGSLIEDSGDDVPRPDTVPIYPRTLPQLPRPGPKSLWSTLLHFTLTPTTEPHPSSLPSTNPVLTLGTHEGTRTSHLGDRPD